MLKASLKNKLSRVNFLKNIFSLKKLTIFSTRIQPGAWCEATSYRSLLSAENRK